MNAEFTVFVATTEPSQSGKTSLVSIHSGGQRQTLEAALKKAHSYNSDSHFVWVERKGDNAHVPDGTRVKNLS